MILYLNLSRRSKKDSQAERQIRRTMRGKVKYIYKIKSLKKRVQAANKISAVFIEADPDSPISELLEYQKDFQQADILLILHNITCNQQIANLLRLYPRYITFDGEIEMDKVLLLLKKQNSFSPPVFFKKQRNRTKIPVSQRQPSIRKNY